MKLKKILISLLCFAVFFSALASINEINVEAAGYPFYTYEKLASGYWVGLVEGRGDGSYSVTLVKKTNSFSTAVKLMNQQESTLNSVACVFYNDQLLSAAYATLDFGVIGYSSTVNSYCRSLNADGVSWQTDDDGKIFGLGYFNGWYQSEGVFFQVRPEGEEENYNMAYTYIGSNRAVVDKTRSSGKYTQYQIVPVSVRRPRNYYKVNEQGSIVHYFAYRNGNSYSQMSLSIGVAPDWMKQGVTYYSADAHYFYTDYLTLIDDITANVHDNAVNDTPWVNYYQFLSIHSATNYTSQDIDVYLQECGIINFALSYDGIANLRTAGKSVLYNSGSYFMQATAIYGLNPIMLLGIAINESSWGRSYYAVTRYNLFGISAYDESSGSASSYTSVLQNICSTEVNSVSDLLSDYASNGSNYYNGSYLGNKDSGFNVKYASDPFWGEKAAAYYYQFDKAMGLKDYNSYVIGITNDSSTVEFYKDAGKTKAGYNSLGATLSSSNMAFIVVAEENGYYKVIADIPIKKAEGYSYDGYKGLFSLEDNYWYIEKDKLTLCNYNSYFTYPSNNRKANKLRISDENTTYTLTEDSPVYTDAYLTNPTEITLEKDVTYSVKQIAKDKDGDYSYCLIYDKDNGNFGWINVSDKEPEEASWTFKRLGGETRYETMALTSQETYADKSCEYIILTTGVNYPDALAGSALAGLLSAPVITTKTNTLSEPAQSEIERLAKDTDTVVYILGGTSAVSKKVETAVNELGYSTVRIAGDTRISTAEKIYQSLSGWSDTCIVAYGNNFPDSLAIGPYAYANKTPIFLANKSGNLADSTLKIITENFTDVIIVGGDDTVSSETETQLETAGLYVLRLAGSTRYETCEQIALWATGNMERAIIQPDVLLSFDGLGVAYAANFPDALTGVNVLGPNKSVLLLASYDKENSQKLTNSLFSNTVSRFKDSIQSGYIFGGTSAVSQGIENHLNSLVK